MLGTGPIRLQFHHSIFIRSGFFLCTLISCKGPNRTGCSYTSDTDPEIHQPDSNDSRFSRMLVFARKAEVENATGKLGQP